MTEQHTQTLADLFDQLAALRIAEADVKARLKTTTEAISDRLVEEVDRAIKSSGKDHGVIYTPPLSGGFGSNRSFTAKIDIDKTVKWDSAKLLEVAKTLPWPRVERIFKIDVSIPERNFQGLDAADPLLAEQCRAARTVKLSAPKITLIEED